MSEPTSIAEQPVDELLAIFSNDPADVAYDPRDRERLLAYPEQVKAQVEQIAERYGWNQ
jgi:hypothetical protein